MYRQPHAMHHQADANVGSGMIYILPRSQTVQIPRIHTPSLLHTTPSFQGLTQSTSIVSFPSIVSTATLPPCQPSLNSLDAFQLSLDSIVENIQDASLGDTWVCPESTSDLAQCGVLDSILSSYCSSPSTSLTTFSSLSSQETHLSSMLNIGHWPVPPCSTPWESTDNVLSMITQLQQIVSELEAFPSADQDDQTLTVPEGPVLKKSCSTATFLSATQSTSSSWISSLDGSFPHSLAYLRDDRTCSDVCQDAPLPLTMTHIFEPVIPRIVLTVPSMDNINSASEDDVTIEVIEVGGDDSDVDAFSISEYYARPSRPRRPPPPPPLQLDLLFPHWTTPHASRTPRTASRIAPGDRHGPEPVLWLCNIASAPLEHRLRNGRSVRIPLSHYASTPGVKSSGWPATTVDRSAVKALFTERPLRSLNGGGSGRSGKHAGIPKSKLKSKLPAWHKIFAFLRR
ncbi:hypothetical protein K474DRAFT_1770842 [Panus rudis PR-1116 ss-1]|nr:hypothetical protein K474DRAFT_1770842 [Panus rudis PR-1116 ss-1]